MDELFRSAGVWAYVGLFALSTGESSAFLGFAVPGETFVLLAGALASRGDLTLEWVIAAVVVGGALGDSIGYSLGRHFGECGKHNWLGRIWTCERMRRVKAFLDRRGRSSIFLARFLGFFRPLAPFAAGAVRMDYGAFLFYNVAGAIAWGVATVLAGYFIGEAAEEVFRAIGIWGGTAVVVVGVALFVWVRLRRRAATPSRAARAPGTSS